MGLLANTVSICHYKVVGETPAGDLFEWASERLARFGFRSIDETTEEESLGWVQLDDHRDSSFAVPNAFWRDHYLVFSLRRDQRRIPAALLKSQFQQAQDDYLAANPGLNRVPKQKREELREAVRCALLARTLPVPATCDAVWDTRTGIVTFTSLGQKVLELFENHFKKSFEGLRLVAFHPFARAESVLDQEQVALLHKANKAGSDAVLDQVRSNLWLGQDFLLWLVYRSLNSAAEYRVRTVGPAAAGDAFTAYPDSRFVLSGETGHGLQKITVAGPQDQFSEVLTALRSMKQITEATLHLEKLEYDWKLTLKGELFHFGSFRSPAVQIEKDNTVDARSEREAVFYERMALLGEGLQLFDSLFATFLAERLDAGWEAQEARIRNWLEQG